MPERVEQPDDVVDLLLAQMSADADPGRRHVVFEPQLVVRQSSMVRRTGEGAA